MKIGLEVHQQLNTHKLFCDCKSEIKKGESDFIIYRKQHAVAGELGKIDVAAAMEAAKKKTFAYEVFEDRNCLVEIDEEPPHQINIEALRIALEISMLLHMKPVDEIQVMRKTVIDGSNTSGFQRTAQVATNGHVETSKGKVRISSLMLEEDAARKTTEEGDKIYFKLDRLGIPLVELRTEPDIIGPEHAKEAAEKIGMILRSSKVKRGIGTIRQDVNISIKGGDRVEIKGAQNLNLIPQLVFNEKKRQEMLICLLHELKKRKVKEVQERVFDITSIFKDTKCNFIKKALAGNSIILAVKLPSFDNLLGPTGFGKELSEHAKVASSVGGIIHSDELPGYAITAEEKKEVSDVLECKANDAFIFIVSEGSMARRAISSLVMRANQAIRGVPREVRRANADATTSFIRPLPGKSRMYPETDLPPITIGKKMVSKIKKSLPEKPWSRMKRYLSLGLNPELASQLLYSKFWDEFEDYTKKFKKLKPKFIASTLLSWRKELKKRFGIEGADQKLLENCIMLIEKGEISKDGLFEVISRAIKKKKGIGEIAKGFAPLSEKELKREVQKAIKENIEASFATIMGTLMEKHKGRIDGKKLAKIVKENL